LESPAVTVVLVAGAPPPGDVPLSVGVGVGVEVEVGLVGAELGPDDGDGLLDGDDDGLPVGAALSVGDGVAPGDGLPVADGLPLGDGSPPGDQPESEPLAAPSIRARADGDHGRCPAAAAPGFREISSQPGAPRDIHESRVR
jgi:hypothetical protein